VWESPEYGVPCCLVWAVVLTYFSALSSRQVVPFCCPALILAAGGQYQGRIRSLCQFFNTTDLLLEVALLQDDDTAWTLLPTTASQGPLQTGLKANLGEVMEEEVFEYERYLPLRGWSPNHLSSLDPRQFSRYRSGAHSSSNFPRVPLPAVSAVCGAWMANKRQTLR
jgi:vacuolar protein sorting-associated protein 13A/C